MENTFVIGLDNKGNRLDKFVSNVLSDLSRSKIQSYIKDGYILVNEKTVNPSYVLKENDIIKVLEFPKETTDLVGVDMPLDIVYEDEYLMVINKPKGLVTHPGAGNFDNTLANGLKGYSDNLSDLNGDFRPGIIHRLDKDTSGLLVIAKTNEAHIFLANQLSDHTLGRTYMALVHGVIHEEEGRIIAPIGRDKSHRLKMAVDLKNGKDAETYFKVLKRYQNATLVECRLKTGRTHQIRVHFDYISHPVIGDPLYGRDNRRIYNDGQLLVAYKISFIHPGDKKRREFEIPLPEYFKEVIDKLN